MSYREAPASIGQRLLWFLEHYRPDTASLNCPVVCKLHGPLDIDELRVALNRLTQRHEALRTTLVRRGRDLVQHVHDTSEVSLRTVPLDPGGTPEACEQRLRGEIEVELQTPVDVTQWPMRTTLWRRSPNEHVLCMNMHHLVSDAWSCGIVMQELIKLLDAGADGEPRLPVIEWQYSQFAQWQHAQLRAGALRVHQDYWTAHLKDMRLIPLPAPAAPVGDANRSSAIETATIDSDVFARLRDVARQERTTIFTVLLSIYYLLLRRVTGQSDLPVASLFANRSRRSVQSTVGFFANMVVLRSSVDGDANFVDVVRQVRRTVVDAFLHEGIPYQILPLTLADSSGRVDDVVFQLLLTPPPGTKVVARGVDFELYTPDTLGSRFTLELGLIPQHTGDCHAMLFYATDRFARAWARAFLDDYVELARAAARHPQGRLIPARV